jgi:hypothetical protein
MLEAIGTELRPLLMVDIDGVLSLFGAGGDGSGAPPDGSFHSIEGIPHFLSASAAAHLLALADVFELVWASGWEERADEHLPHLLGLPSGLPFLRFERDVGARLGGRAAGSHGHWKLQAIEQHADGRALAWVDDALDEACHQWARARAAPTLLVQTDPRMGLTGREFDELIGWARGLPGAR